MEKKKFAVVLSGCGVYDGAEIHEATMTMLSIIEEGGVYQCFAPDIPQYHVINHLTGEEMDESRNVLIESARIARGDIKPLSEFKAEDYDALIFPGGFGAAKNLSTVAFDGPNAKVNPEVEDAIKQMLAVHKPIGALCISPAVVARVIQGVEVTIGNDPGTAEAIEKMGSKHVVTTHGQVVHDHKYNVFTTPCYMLDATIMDIKEDASVVVKEMMKELGS
ncbi:isoprenoid biosynthesis glyoxalase ElbB [Candidatus Sulfidibacterium hydrothermale]|uniref:isoprenoid biosynthesis glyoxalase ElbB n=1 Tax=Candidatus Sulfidibacterium hydrothermale TaxID=2875962 RepID=UPI001F0AEC39|nr:isoprenoid biosynthesis glyoxalase ElbB [Candidatus Sulfidibacterium hydrothermale]UBM61962.1 isoprenoid biosynthesis glyoxalase ElbB [Candidatus Sulfidibacterium hydrothermale]